MSFLTQKMIWRKIKLLVDGMKNPMCPRFYKERLIMRKKITACFRRFWVKEPRRVQKSYLDEKGYICVVVRGHPGCIPGVSII